MIVCGFAVVFSSLLYYSVDLCACVEVYVDFRWNYVRVY
jgi:hypothetical protein